MMQAKDYDEMLNSTYAYARKTRDFANMFEAQGDEHSAYFWHIMADKLFDVVEHGDNYRSNRPIPLKKGAFDAKQS